ncbi:MAG: peptidylprolyl isomerase [Bacteroidales bacterium]|nr:peptidylprolyl isomerase [Bacteroidales bacterium]
MATSKSEATSKVSDEVNKTDSQDIKTGQKAIISTKFGDMTILLYDETPKHRDNFIKLIKDGFYDGTLFHRVIRDFMIQGGDPDSKNAAPGQRLGSGGPGYTIEAEFNPEFIHKKGALSAARMGDQVNPKKESSGSQFYIVQGKKATADELNRMAPRTGAIYTTDQIKTYQTIGGTPFLDNQYTVFGEVIEGLDVIDQIAAVKTQPGDRPVEDVKMTIKLIEE